MSKKIFLDAFYTQFADFLTQLTQVFPNDPDFPAYKTGLYLLQKTNPMLVADQVILHVLPFETIIRSRNEDFFLKHEFSEYNTLDQVIDKLKHLWEQLSDQDKKCVWDYITLLLDLAKRCALKDSL
jgi:hypothetical protein